MLAQPVQSEALRWAWARTAVYITASSAPPLRPVSFGHRPSAAESSSPPPTGPTRTLGPIDGFFLWLIEDVYQGATGKPDTGKRWFVRCQFKDVPVAYKRLNPIDVAAIRLIDAALHLAARSPSGASDAMARRLREHRAQMLKGITGQEVDPATPLGDLRQKPHSAEPLSDYSCSQYCAEAIRRYGWLPGITKFVFQRFLFCNPAAPWLVRHVPWVRNHTLSPE